MSILDNQLKWEDLISQPQETQKTLENTVFSEVFANIPGRARTCNLRLRRPTDSIHNANQDNDLRQSDSPFAPEFAPGESETDNADLSDAVQHITGEGADQGNQLLKITAALQAIPPADLANLAKILNALAQCQEKAK